MRACSLTLEQLLVVISICVRLFTRQTRVGEQVLVGDLLHDHRGVLRVAPQLQGAHNQIACHIPLMSDELSRHIRRRLKP